MIRAILYLSKYVYTKTYRTLHSYLDLDNGLTNAYMMAHICIIDTQENINDMYDMNHMVGLDVRLILTYGNLVSLTVPTCKSLS